MSKCRGDQDLGLYTFFVLAKREPLRNGDFRKKKCVLPTEKIGIWFHSRLIPLHGVLYRLGIHSRALNEKTREKPKSIKNPMKRNQTNHEFVPPHCLKLAK